MAFTKNTATIMGNLGADAVTAATTNGTLVTSFRLATTHGVKQTDGSYKEVPTWHNVVAFKVGDWIKSNLKKGTKWEVDGRIQNRSYEKDGVKHHVSEIIANEIYPCFDARNGNTAPAQSADVPDGMTDDDLPF